MIWLITSTWNSCQAPGYSDLCSCQTSYSCPFGTLGCLCETAVSTRLMMSLTYGWGIAQTGHACCRQRVIAVLSPCWKLRKEREISVLDHPIDASVGSSAVVFHGIAFLSWSHALSFASSSSCGLVFSRNLARVQEWGMLSISGNSLFKCSKTKALVSSRFISRRELSLKTKANSP